MGAYVGAEVCKVICNFVLSLLSKHINKDHVGLYSNNGLALLKNISDSEVEKPKKEFQKLFKEKYLDIFAQYNSGITNYQLIITNY